MPDFALLRPPARKWTGIFFQPGANKAPGCRSPHGGACVFKRPCWSSDSNCVIINSKQLHAAGECRWCWCSYM